MKGVFQAAMAKMTDRADSMTINVADPAEKPIVDKFCARGAPMPMVLAIAPTGAAYPAFPKQFDEAQLQQAFVSPCTAKCMRAIQDRHTILICVQNDKTQFNEEAMQGVKAFKADPQYGKATEIIMLDPADKAEQHFLTDLQVDPRTTTAVTVLVTPPGAPVARFTGAVTEEQITAKIKEAKSSCGAGCSCHNIGDRNHAITNPCVARNLRAQEPIVHQFSGDPAGNHGDRLDQEHHPLLRRRRGAGDGLPGGQCPGASQDGHLAGLLQRRPAKRDDSRGIRHATGDGGPCGTRQHLAQAVGACSSYRARTSRSRASCRKTSFRRKRPGAARASFRARSAAAPRSE